MEKVLIKMAEQLAALDEASLTSLWDKYEEMVREFQPTKRWEQAVLVLGMIQILRWKNHLFNHHWAAQQKPAADSHAPSPSSVRTGSGDSAGQPKSAKVLPFLPSKVE